MADGEGSSHRKRARQACLACNARRVKCNVVESRPCDNCVAANVRCETRESRRGKHPRPSKRRQSEGGDRAVPISDGKQHPDEVAASHVLASLHKNRLSDAFQRPADQDIAPKLDALSPLQLDQRQQEDEDVFLGESSSLRYVNGPPSVDQLGPPTPNTVGRFRHSVPNAVRADSLVPQWEVERKQSRIALLKSEGAFSVPAPVALNGLLKAYFQWFHPSFAVVDEMEIWNLQAQGTISPLLLQAILFIGVIHCDESTLGELNLGSRHRAKYIFYNRAKDIYDAECETKKLTVIQALFLMSFWRAGALLEKDSRHWLGTAITLAQTKALHRSIGKAENQASRLQKRLWWSLYTRERQCAAALGLPNRVRDEDCDIESLEVSDFFNAFHHNIAAKKSNGYATHAICMAELAAFLGRIVHSGYLPNQMLSRGHRIQIREEILKWRQQLPQAIQPGTAFGEQPGLHANMQHLAFNNLMILLHRSAFIVGEDDDNEVDGTIALQAAARNSRVIEDMLSEGDLRHGQIHVITNLFNTLCIHTVHLRRSEGTTRTVAEHRAKLCLLGLQELQKTWEVTNWVLQLFFQYLDRATAERLRVPQEDESGTSSTAHLSREAIQSTQHLLAIDALTESKPLGEVAQPETLANLPNVPPLGTAPWAWTNEEANQFLFSQIENEFAFGEGGVFDWSPSDATLGGTMPQGDDLHQGWL